MDTQYAKDGFTIENVFISSACAEQSPSQEAVVKAAALTKKARSLRKKRAQQFHEAIAAYTTGDLVTDYYRVAISQMLTTELRSAILLDPSDYRFYRAYANAPDTQKHKPAALRLAEMVRRNLALDVVLATLEEVVQEHKDTWMAYVISLHAVRLDPLSPLTQQRLGYTLRFLRKAIANGREECRLQWAVAYDIAAWMKDHPERWHEFTDLGEQSTKGTWNMAMAIASTGKGDVEGELGMRARCASIVSHRAETRPDTRTCERGIGRALKPIGDSNLRENILYEIASRPFRLGRSYFDGLFSAYLIDRRICLNCGPR